MEENNKIFKTGDYVFLSESVEGSPKEEVYIVARDWQYRPGNNFNRLYTYSLEGKEVNFSSSWHRSQIQLLPKHLASKYERKASSQLAELLERDDNTIKQVKYSLQAIFPNNWELKIGNNILEPYLLTIKFPNIEITNGNNLKHTISDLYVRWAFKEGFVISRRLAGVRGLVDYVEYKCGYSHSHLPSVSYTNNVPEFNTFCLGSGDFATANSEWAMPDHEFTQEGFELLLYQLDGYVKWESLQGGPYMRIENIAIGDINMYLNDTDMGVQFRIIVKNLDKFPLKFNNVTRRFETESFLLESHISGIEGITHIKKTSGGDYIYGDVSRATIENWIVAGNTMGATSDPILNFKGEDIFFKVMELSKEYD